MRNKNKKRYYGVCDVCCLVDGDTSYKEVTYCPLCKAYICDKCRKDTYKRALAMVKGKMYDLCSEKDRPKPIE